MGIAESIRNNLVSNTYIHSNTDNFVYINNIDMRLKRSATLQKDLEKALKTINHYINIITQQCNQFYSELDILERDSFNSSTGDFLLQGAKYFSNHFLGKKDGLTEQDSLSTILLTIMDSVHFKNLFFEKVNNSIELEIDREAFLKDWGEFYQKNQMPGYFKLIVNNVGDITTSTITNAINRIFESKTLRTRKDGTQIKGTRLRSDLKNADFLSEDDIKQARKNNQGAEELKEKLRKKYIKERTATPEQIAELLWLTLIECDFYNYPNANQIDKQTFIDYYSKAIQKYQTTDVNVNILENKSSYSGFILEETTVFAIVNDLKINKMLGNIIDETRKEGVDFTRVIGQEKTNKMYQNSKGSLGSRLVEKGQDIQIVTNKGHVYYIQAKNSFSEAAYQPTYLQSTILVDTYAYTVLDKDSAEELEYLIFNKAYLSNNGVNKQGGKNYYKNQSKTDEYINFFLYQTLAYLVAGKEKQDLYNPDTFQGNLFFIYKGRYLIPVSVFLYSAYNLIRTILSEENGDIWDFKNYGNLVYSKTLKNVNFSPDEAKKYRFRKLATVKDYWHYIDYQQDYDLSWYAKYPDNMISIGKEIGEHYKDNASFQKLTFTLKIEELDKLLKW